VFPNGLQPATNPALNSNGEWCVTINLADRYDRIILQALAPAPGNSIIVPVEIAHGQFVRDTETCTGDPPLDPNGLPCYKDVWYGFAGIQNQTIQLNNTEQDMCKQNSSSKCFVAIDMQPGTAPNVVIKGSNSTIPVTILSRRNTFDATKLTQTDLKTITLGGAKAIMKGTSVKVETPDTNKDGVKDIMLYFELAKMIPLLDKGERKVTLKGTFKNTSNLSVAFEGNDMLVVK
jgi:hypothetical protein